MAIYRRCACTKPEGGRYGQLPERPTDTQRARACPRLVADPKHGLWGFALSRGFDGAGKRLQVRQGNFTTKREAQQAYAAAKAAHDQGAYVEPTRTTLGQYLPEWLAAQVKAGVYRPNTAVKYGRYITKDLVPSRLGAMKLTDLRRGDVKAFIAGLDRGASTVREIHKVLTKALNDAVDSELIGSNPAERVALPREARAEKQWLTPAQVGQFLDAAAAHRLGDLYVVVMFTGLRRGEVAGLRWEDVDLASRTLTLRQARVVVQGRVTTGPLKTDSSRRTVSLEDVAAEALVSWQMRQALERDAAREAWTDTGYVFTMPDGQPVNPDYIYRQVRRFCDRAGVPRITFHDQRHESASLMIEAGADLVLVQKRLGHKNQRITADTYSHLIGDASREAAARASSLVPRTPSAQPLHNAAASPGKQKAPALPH